MKKAAFVALCMGLLVPSAAMAAVLDFSTGTGGAGGTVVNIGGGDALGFDIRIDTLVVSGAGAFDGVATSTAPSLARQAEAPAVAHCRSTRPPERCPSSGACRLSGFR